MDYVYLRVFLENYSLPTLIISAIISVITLIYDKFFADKLPVIIRNFLPFFLGVILYFAYDMLFVLKCFSFSAGTFSAGFLSGSLSVIMTSSLYRLKHGKPLNINAVHVLIENLISDYVNADSLCTTVDVIKGLIDKDINLAQAQIEDLLSSQALNTDKAELKAISYLIVKAVTAVKQK